MKGTCDFELVLRLIRDADRILLCTHLMPDGDALGSLLALGGLCGHLGKPHRMICHHGVPAYLRFLPGQEEIRLPQEVAGEAFDLAISIDASDAERLGDSAKYFYQAATTVQMDHHQTNAGFAQHNLVLEELPASGSLLFRFYETAGVPITREMAICLYTAISTDTGNFCFGSVTAETFQQAAHLMACGLPLAETARALHLMQEKEQVLLQGRALSSLRFFEEGKLTEMRLTRQDFIDCGAGSEHADSIVNMGLYIPGVKMCYLASEQADGIKFSLRAIAPSEVAGLALALGGGGHAQAAGCTLQGPMDGAIARVRDAMQGALRP
ncbi:MAG: bifunctional oligoribonuclease/PAP phosphatase NrnA [Christensenellales bacterium]